MTNARPSTEVPHKHRSAPCAALGPSPRTAALAERLAKLSLQRPNVTMAAGFPSRSEGVEDKG